MCELLLILITYYFDVLSAQIDELKVYWFRVIIYWTNVLWFVCRQTFLRRIDGIAELCVDLVAWSLIPLVELIYNNTELGRERKKKVPSCTPSNPWSACVLSWSSWPSLLKTSLLLDISSISRILMPVSDWLHILNSFRDLLPFSKKIWSLQEP